MTQAGTWENAHRFSTKEWDEKSGLYYFGARYYSPEIGRWTQRDPAGTAESLNPYLYINDEPVWAVDPWGRQRGLPDTFDIHLTPNSQNVRGTVDAEIWYRPPSGSCCDRVILRQIAQTRKKQGFPWVHWPSSSDFSAWHPDWPDPVELMRPFVRGKPWPQGEHAGWEDWPGWEPKTPGSVRIYLKQEFETCAICFDVNSSEYKRVYGCVSWAFEVHGVGDVTILKPRKTKRPLDLNNFSPARASDDFKALFPDLHY